MHSLFTKIAVAAASLVFIVVPSVHSQNPELAKDLAEEGVTNEAKIKFVRVLHDASKKAAYPEAHYYLGYLSFKEKNYDRALMHWKILVKEYPDSRYTTKAQEQIQLAYVLLSRQQELVGESLDINNLFENAEFLVGEPLKVSVDTSYLSTGDLAIEWLEDVVTKFPGSPDAPRALFREALVYYGWGKNGIGQYSNPEGYGFRFYAYYDRSPKMAQFYIEKMVAVSTRLEKEYPDSPYRVPVAFMIGQAYWASSKGQTNDAARTYWTKVLELTQKDLSNSYRQIAEKRLK
jgi:outer membrane protein assembly factor BamD (BamD/ComL family)